MKLNYEQYRMLAQLGPSNDRIVIKNRKGVILKPAVHKWHPRLKGMQYTCTEEPQRPFHAHTESRSLISRQAGSSPRQVFRGKL